MKSFDSLLCHSSALTLVQRGVLFVLVLLLHIGLLAASRALVNDSNAVPQPSTLWMQTKIIAAEPLPAAPIEMPKPVPSPIAPQPKPQTRKPSVEKTKVTAKPAEKTLAATTAATNAANFSIATVPVVPEKIATETIPVVTPVRFDAAYLKNPAPVYPVLSKRLHEEGKVYLLVHVTEDGLADEVSVKQSSGFPRLDEAAVNSVRVWRFVPARKDEQKIAASVVVPIVFHLDEG